MDKEKAKNYQGWLQHFNHWCKKMDPVEYAKNDLWVLFCRWIEEDDVGQLFASTGPGSPPPPPPPPPDDD